MHEQRIIELLEAILDEMCEQTSILKQTQEANNMAQQAILDAINNAAADEAVQLSDFKTAMEAAFARLTASLAGANVDPAVVEAAVTAGHDAFKTSLQALTDEANAQDPAPVNPPPA